MQEKLELWFPNVMVRQAEFVKAFRDTLAMFGTAGAFVLLFGLFFGVLLMGLVYNLITLLGIDSNFQNVFIGLFLAFMAVSTLAHMIFETTGLASGYLCGISPVAIGFFAYSSYAWPDLHIKGSFGLMNIYAGIVGLFLFVFPLLDAFAFDFLSCGVGPIAACLALGAILGRQAKK